MPINEVLVCSHGVMYRFPDYLRRLDEPLTLKPALTRADLLRELTQGQHPICMIEHELPDVDPRVPIEQAQHSPPGRTALDLLPELVSRSPGTKFVITAHTRWGIPREQKALYQQRPEVVKVIGLVDSHGHDLLKLLSRVYFGKTWKPKTTPAP